MTYNNKLLTINELQEVKYFSDEQKEFLKDYQFSYILQNYCDVSMQTDDDCGHSITKIAVVENKEYGNIKDIGTIDIATTTFCYYDEIPTLFGSDESVEHYISSDNISGFPSHCNKITKNMFSDNRKEMFNKLGILNDAEKWFIEKAFTEEVIKCNDPVTKYLEDKFSEHIFCDKCHSIIPSSHWINCGFTRELVEFDAEREYFDMVCPICKEHKEVDADKHIELNKFEDKAELPNIDLLDPFGDINSKNPFDKAESHDIDLIDQFSDINSQNPFDTVEVSDVDLQKPFDKFKQNPFDDFNNLGPKACSICGKMFCEHRYPF